MMLKQRKLYPVTKSVGGGVMLEVCWRDDRFGKGPCFSVYERKREMMRFDLFEVGAHWHSYREAMQPRHYFVDVPAPGKRTDHGMAKLFQDAIEIAQRAYPRITSEVRTWLWGELVAQYRRVHPAQPQETG